ncbi:hypothetical protein [Paenibacillus soyae]|uniref:Uncharacterized protein n=1 Tax=Paenibacillus soyae TaxID=2969249 RepID=A0A9X2MW45_9BACL|nr:hypothetical protein [Paenibacillus soyae]MCR2807520.1 hypothetical protein [Paenibacillus soyae]
MSKKIGQIIGVLFSIICFSLAVYGSRFFENGITDFMLYLFLLPSLLALIGSMFNKPFINTIAFIWLIPACLYFTIGPFLIILHFVAIAFMFLSKKNYNSANRER